jgi:hypothetical protein
MTPLLLLPVLLMMLSPSVIRVLELIVSLN